KSLISCALSQAPSLMTPSILMGDFAQRHWAARSTGSSAFGSPGSWKKPATSSRNNTAARAERMGDPFRSSEGYTHPRHAADAAQAAFSPSGSPRHRQAAPEHGA